MKFLYQGPLSAVTLGDGSEVMLHPDAEVDLPVDHEYTQTLRAQGYLTPLNPSTNGVSKTKKESKGVSDGS